MAGRVLTIAESDSCGGSGIQADVKTILALGGYATTALTGITAQNTTGIQSFQMLDPLLVADQIRSVINDVGTDAIKVGALGHEIVVDTVADLLDEYQNRNYAIVVDPSLVARNGELVVDESAVPAIKRRLFVRATVLAPNLQEAELLTGMHIRDLDNMRHAAAMMRTFGVDTVVLKAGKVLSDKILYFVANEHEERVYERPHIDTPHTLGAGCTLSSAIAISLAQKMPVFAAVERALDFLHQAILRAPGYGQGQGPMNHAFNIEQNAGVFHPANVKIHKA